MLFLLSIALVFGAVAVFIGNIAASEQGTLGLGYQQMIHARIPWLLIVSALGGAGIGIFSLVRARRWYKWGIVPVEIFFAALLTWYFASVSFLPEHRLALQVGDPFPGYSLVDQDGKLQTSQSATPRRPALYVFYRGDW